MYAAYMSGVRPASLGKFMSAPAASSSCATAALPPAAAHMQRRSVASRIDIADVRAAGQQLGHLLRSLAICPLLTTNTNQLLVQEELLLRRKLRRLWCHQAALDS